MLNAAAAMSLIASVQYKQLLCCNTVAALAVECLSIIVATDYIYSSIDSKHELATCATAPRALACDGGIGRVISLGIR
jgi:hypothetical protein